jgi:hypothetical protein
MVVQKVQNFNLFFLFFFTWFLYHIESSSILEDSVVEMSVGFVWLVGFWRAVSSPIFRSISLEFASL